MASKKPSFLGFLKKQRNV